MAVRVLLKIPRPSHAAYRIIAANPPPGYEYEQEFKPLYEQGGLFRRQVAKVLEKSPRLKDLLLLSRERFGSRRQTERPCSLIFSLGIYSAFNPIPTILYLEDAGAEAAHNPSLERNRIMRGGIKKILAGNPTAAETFRAFLSDAEFDDLVGVVRPGVPLPPLLTRESRDTVNLLFVSSGNYAQNARYALLNFALRGGREVLSAFRLLNKQLGSKVRLTLVGVIPAKIASEYSDVLSLGNVVSSGRILTKPELDQVYAASDVFLYAGYRGPWLTIAEAYSFGLPAVGSDTWDMHEYIMDGRTGLLIQRDDSKKVVIRNHQPIWNTEEIMEGAIDGEFVKKYAEGIARLVLDARLRELMGRNGRETVERGFFSINHMQAELGKFFDECMQ